MAVTTSLPAAGRLTLRARTAADLMRAGPPAVPRDADVHTALALLADRGTGGAPAADAAGRAVGVATPADILFDDREGANRLPEVSDFYRDPDRSARRLLHGGRLRPGDRRTAGEVMTPGLIAVAPDTPAGRVVDELLGRHIRRLFVVAAGGRVLEVVGLFDIPRRLRH